MTCRLLVSQKAFPQRDVLSCAQDEHRTGQEAPPGQRRVQLCKIDKKKLNGCVFRALFFLRKTHPFNFFGPFYSIINM